jgi:hypothetical protein
VISNEILLKDGKPVAIGLLNYSTELLDASMFEDPTIALRNNASIYAADSDSDGYLDILEVDVLVNVSVPGNYTFVPVVRTGLGIRISFPSTTARLDKGDSLVALACDGTRLYLAGYNGSYVLDSIVIYFSGYIADEASYGSVSPFYNYTDFDRPSLMIRDSPFEDVAVDSDCDGIYDYLQVTVTVEVQTAGQYLLYANLYDQNLGYVDSALNCSSLEVGTWLVSFRFSSVNRTPFSNERLLVGITGVYASFGELAYVPDMLFLTNAYSSSDFGFVSTSYNILIQLKQGWNVVSIPLVDYKIMASELGLHTGDIVSKWDSANQSYVSDYLVGISPSSYDFELQVGVSYMIWANSDEEISITGCAPELYSMINITLAVPEGGGWVPVGWVSSNTSVHASDLASFVEGAKVFFVSRLNTSLHLYEIYIVGISPMSFDFEIKPGEGYWIWIDRSGTMSYQP